MSVFIIEAIRIFEKSTMLARMSFLLYYIPSLVHVVIMLAYLLVYYMQQTHIEP